MLCLCFSSYIIIFGERFSKFHFLKQVNWREALQQFGEKEIFKHKEKSLY